METIDLKNWEEFEAKLKSLREKYKDAPTPLLFRGECNSKFELQTTLERAGRQKMPISDYYQLVVARLKPNVETFTDMAWDILEKPEDFLKVDSDLRNDGTDPASVLRSSPLYSYLAFLRHHGFPSPLLDWTQSPYVAAFFAFNDRVENTATARSIYVYCEMPNNFKGSWGSEPTIAAMGPYVRSHARHFRQRSTYTFCSEYVNNRWCFAPHVFGHKDQDVLWKLNLPSAERVRVLSVLNDYCLDAFSLFGSVESLLETAWMREYVLGYSDGAE